MVVVVLAAAGCDMPYCFLKDVIGCFYLGGVVSSDSRR